MLAGASADRTLEKHGTKRRRAWRRLYGALDVKRSSLAPRSDVSLYAARSSGDAAVAVGGELAMGGADFAPRACIRGVPRDPDHDAAVRIGGVAPGRRAHSAPRLGGHACARVTTTSDRHRPPATAAWRGAGPPPP